MVSRKQTFSHLKPLNWLGKRILVTGGVGFIGSHLVEQLLDMGAILTVVDKLKTKGMEKVWHKRLQRYRSIWEDRGYKLETEFSPRYCLISDDHVALITLDLETEKEELFRLLQKREIEYVFHLAAVFGGRGFVEERQADCAVGFAINHNVISAAHLAGVKHVHFASSACVYPPSLNKPNHLLKEDDVLSVGEGWRSSDNVYGFVKLMGELELKAFHEQYGLEGSVARYLTVYGPGEFDESHAIASFIWRAVRRENPFVVWGDGNQERGFTFVKDIVSGTIRCAEVIRDATPVNLGWNKRYKIREVVDMILEVAGYRPEIIYDRSKPTGPQSRALDITRAKHLLGWEPKVDLPEGIRITYQWASSQQKSTLVT